MTYNPIRYSWSEHLVPGDFRKRKCASFRAFLRALGEHRRTDNKSDMPLFSLGRYRGPRKVSNLEGLARVFAADLDHLSLDELLSIEETLREGGWAHAIISSHNHLQPKFTPSGREIPPGPRVRVLLELDQEPQAAEWPSVWQYFQAKIFDGHMDPACKDLARAYFVPSARPGAEVLYVVEGGEPFPLETARDVAAADLIAPQRIDPSQYRPVDRTLLEDVFARWYRSRSIQRKEQGLLGRRILAEEALDVPERHIALRNLFWVLVHEEPATYEFDPQDVVELCLTSCARSRVRGKNDIQPDEIEKLWTSAVENAVSQNNKKTKELYARLRESIRNTSRPEEKDRGFVTNRELERLQEVLGVSSISGVVQSLIFHSRSTNWFLRPDGSVCPYPCENSMLPAESREHLAVFYPHFEHVNPSPSDLIEQNSRQVDKIVYSYTRQAQYDAVSRSLIIDPLRAKKHEPEPFDPMLDWLDAICDHNGDKSIVDWFSALPELDKPCGALVLEGPAGTGKTLTAFLAARYFGCDTPVAIDNITGNFSSEILSCPVVLGDETAGSRYKKDGSEYLRREISHTTRQINKKYSDEISLEGCLRYVFACNGLSIFSNSNERLSTADIDAFCERMIHVRLPKSLQKLMSKELGSSKIQSEWIDSGAASRCIEWLHREWVREESGVRFAVAGQPDSALRAELLTSHGLRGEVLAFCYQFLSWRLGRDRTLYRTDRIAIKDGKLWLCGEVVHEYWRVAFTEESRRPRLGVLTQVVQEISVGEPKKFGRHRLWAVDPTLVLAGADRYSIGVEGVRRALMDDRPNVRRPPSAGGGARRLEKTLPWEKK